MKSKPLLLVLAVLAVAFLLPSLVLAHPGRTDSSGCHTCRTNCSNWGLSYGEYHCHRVKAAPQPKPPVKSSYGEGGTGKTQPAPEYTNPSVLTPKNTETSQTATISETVKQQPKKGFWQWLFSLFGK